MRSPRVRVSALLAPMLPGTLLRGAMLLGVVLGAASIEAAPRAQPAPYIGDVVHGEALLKAGDANIPVDGAWLNAFTYEDAVARLAKGNDGFPRVESDNVLDRWDALSAVQARNTLLVPLLMGGDTVLISATKLDDNAQARLRDKAQVPAAALDEDRRVFTVFKLGAAELGAASNVRTTPYSLVRDTDSRQRDQLKKDSKVGYVVFVKIPGFRGGAYEAAFAVDKSIRVEGVVIRAPDGSAPADLNQAAARFIGKGARGQYAPLKAGGAGRSVGELERPLSDAFLVAAESIYMYEVAEREYFAFDN